MIEKNKIYLGNNLEILKTFPDNSIDSIVTDPPYGISLEVLEASIDILNARKVVIGYEV